MKISCNVVQDLLPLYAEDMASVDSKAIVQEHLKCCAGCKNALKKLQIPLVDTTQLEAENLSAVSKTIRRQKRMVAGFAVLVTLTLLISMFLFLISPVYLEAEDAVYSVEINEDGLLMVSCKTNAACYEVKNYTVGTSEKVINYIVAARMWKHLFFKEDGGKGPFYHPLDELVSVTYGYDNSVIWGEEREYNLAHEQSEYAVWIKGLAVVGLCFLVTSLIFRSWRRGLLDCAVIALSGVLAAMISLGFDIRNLVFIASYQPDFTEYLIITAVHWCLILATYFVGRAAFQKM